MTETVLDLNSSIFDVDTLPLVGTTEKVVKGSRDLFPLLTKAFGRNKQIGVIGWGSQGPSQAQNIRDSLIDTDYKVVVGLRENSKSCADAEKAGFSEKERTLDEMYKVIRESDIVILLISDSAQAEHFKKIMAQMKVGATLGLSHGFLLGHMNNEGTTWREDINVIMVAPKGMGPSVRQLYLQGAEVNGAGINSSIAIEQDYTGEASNLAIAWAIAIGSPYLFLTTMKMEFKSDIFGERADLLGGVWALSEVLYRKYKTDGMSDEDAFKNSVESITGPISEYISENGLLGIVDLFTGEEKSIFIQAYNDFYFHSSHVMENIYDEVSSGREIEEVILKGNDLDSNPMKPVDSTQMWEVGKVVRSKRVGNNIPLNPYTAGAYIAMIMAQVDLLSSKGHCWSEIANESVIEATDSLNPYMHKKGVANMIDNCSVTAKLGARKWGPIFENSFGLINSNTQNDDELFESFINNPIHEVLYYVGQMRPTVKITL